MEVDLSEAGNQALRGMLKVGSVGLKKNTKKFGRKMEYLEGFVRLYMGVQIERMFG